MFTEHLALFGKPVWMRWEYGVWGLHAENWEKMLTWSTSSVLTWHYNAPLTFAAGCDSATWEGSPFTYWIRMHATGSSSAHTCCILQNRMGRDFSCSSIQLNTWIISPFAQCFFSPHVSKVKSLFSRPVPSSSEAEPLTFELQGTTITPLSNCIFYRFVFSMATIHITPLIFSVTMWLRKSCQETSLNMTIYSTKYPSSSAEDSNPHNKDLQKERC